MITIPTNTNHVIRLWIHRVAVSSIYDVAFAFIYYVLMTMGTWVVYLLLWEELKTKQKSYFEKSWKHKLVLWEEQKTKQNSYFENSLNTNSYFENSWKHKIVLREQQKTQTRTLRTAENTNSYFENRLVERNVTRRLPTTTVTY